MPYGNFKTHINKLKNTLLLKYYLLLLFALSIGNLTSQNLEEAIYNATETFNNSKSETSLQQLNKQIETFKPKLFSIDEHFAFLSLLINKAYYLSTTNKQQLAINTYVAALKHYQNNKIGETYKYNIIDYCLIPLGNLYIKSGDYTNAENIIKQYIFLAEKTKNNRQRVSGAINLAQLYYTIGKFKSAITIIESGLKINNISNSQLQKLESIKNNCLLASKQSSQIISENIIKKSNKDHHLNYRLALKNEDYEKALEYFILKSLELEKEKLTTRDNAKLNVEEAQLYYKLNDFKKASQALQSALLYLLPNHISGKLPKKSDLYPENTFIDIFDLLALIKSDTHQALSYYNLSFYVSELLTKNLTSNEAKLIHIYDNRERSEACIAILHNLYQQQQNTSIAEKAFFYAEKNKASILKSNIDKKSLLELNPQDSLLLREQILLHKNEQLTNQLITAQYAKDSQKSNQLSKKLTEISLELKTLNTNISKRYPNHQSNIDLNNLQQKLKQDNAILIEYFYGKNAIYQFVISQSSILLNRIERNDTFNTSIKKYISFFKDASAINNNINAYKSKAHELYKTLNFNTITNHIENIVVIPDGLLNFIPFESLLTETTSTNSYSKMPFLVKDRRLTYNSSAKFYLENKSFNNTSKLLGVFPVFENSNAELSFSIDESKSIDKYINATFLMHQKATKKAFLENAPNYSILHLSTHADSGSFLEPSHIEFYDSTLYVNELYSLDLKLDLVVLSACETGIGVLNKGEGSINLARGFQYAGAKNILFSLWKINDLSTSKLMHNFYKNYAKTKSINIANQKSKINYLNDNTIKNNMKSPYYWSPFIYYGAIKNNKTEPFPYYIIFSILCLIILFLAIKKAYYGK